MNADKNYDSYIDLIYSRQQSDPRLQNIQDAFLAFHIALAQNIQNKAYLEKVELKIEELNFLARQAIMSERNKKSSPSQHHDSDTTLEQLLKDFLHPNENESESAIKVTKNRFGRELTQREKENYISINASRELRRRGYDTLQIGRVSHLLSISEIMNKIDDFRVYGGEPIEVPHQDDIDAMRQDMLGTNFEMIL